MNKFIPYYIDLINFKTNIDLIDLINFKTNIDLIDLINFKTNIDLINFKLYSLENIIVGNE